MEEKCQHLWDLGLFIFSRIQIVRRLLHVYIVNADVP